MCSSDLVGFTPQEYGEERVARKGLERLRWELERYEPFALAVYNGRTPEVKSVNAPVRMPASRMEQGELEGPRCDATLRRFLDPMLAAGADTIVLGVPMYNFDVPSTLKAYFDHIARAGVTFRYTANGLEGLLKGKTVYVFASRGGMYAGKPFDTQTGYLKNFLGLLGITDVRFVYAEGIAISAESKQAALANAQDEVARLLATVNEKAAA